MRIDLYGSWRNQLGESPLWDADRQRLFWVDTVARCVCCADAHGDHFRSYGMPDLVGSIALAEGGLIAALREGFYRIDLTQEEAPRIRPLILPERGNSAVRFNDGKADRQGRVLAGTMRVGDVAGAPGVLYRLELDASCSVLQRDIAVANALCFSPAGNKLYFADSLRSRVWCFDYDGVTGTLSGRRPLIDTRDWGSVPDGATVDAAGDLWIALFQTQQIAHCSSQGRLFRLIDLPAPYPSCVAFGGADLQTLFVTTISNSGHRIKTDHPQGGRMLAITGLETQGLPEARHRGSYVSRSALPDLQCT
jgi:sugar lactone lactonase YvrE